MHDEILSSIPTSTMSLRHNANYNTNKALSLGLHSTTSLVRPCASFFLAHQNAVKADTFLQTPHIEAHSEAVRDFN